MVTDERRLALRTRALHIGEKPDSFNEVCEGATHYVHELC